MRTIITLVLGFCLITACKIRHKTQENKPTVVESIQQQPIDTCASIKDSIYKLIYINKGGSYCTAHRLDSLIPLYKDCILQMDSIEIGRYFIKYRESTLERKWKIGDLNYTAIISPRIPIYKNGKRYEDAHNIYSSTRGSYYIVVDFDPITRKPIDVRVSFGNGGATPTD